MLPSFTRQGFLPPGIHAVEDWSEFLGRFATTPLRRRVVEGFQEGLRSLGSAGCHRVVVDGDLITAAERPHGFQALWETTAVDLTQLDPVLQDTRGGGAAQRLRFRGTFHATGPLGSVSSRTFLKLLQLDTSSGDPKGVVALLLAQVRL